MPEYCGFTVHKLWLGSGQISGLFTGGVSAGRDCAQLRGVFQTLSKFCTQLLRNFSDNFNSVVVGFYSSSTGFTTTTTN